MVLPILPGYVVISRLLDCGYYKRWRVSFQLDVGCSRVLGLRVKGLVGDFLNGRIWRTC